MNDTRLARALDGACRPDALAAFRAARRRFLSGERLDMGTLAAELGVSRATLFRWVGNRDQLLTEVIWSLTAPSLAEAARTAPGRGPRRLAAAIGRFTRAAIEAPNFGLFLRREPERALRILTTRRGSFQIRLRDAVEELLAAEPHCPEWPLPVHDLAFLVVRVVESFVYTDLITGEPPDAAKAERAVAVLLGCRDLGPTDS